MHTYHLQVAVLRRRKRVELELTEVVRLDEDELAAGPGRVQLAHFVLHGDRGLAGRAHPYLDFLQDAQGKGKSAVRAQAFCGRTRKSVGGWLTEPELRPVTMHGKLVWPRLRRFVPPVPPPPVSTKEASAPAEGSPPLYMLCWMSRVSALV